MRPKSLRHHGGQISLPGGKIETGESDLQAALREFEEELGVSLSQATFCGTLPPIYVYASDNLVSPIVLVGDAPSVAWQPDLFEVDRVFELPLEVLLSKKPMSFFSRQRHIMRGDEAVGSFQFKTPVFHHEGHRIWGATAMLLAELSDLFRQFRG
jgi:8-oxo-dGTP pyrophosphatase MutT (NUDIX family)